jgi:hypothetical protein
LFTDDHGLALRLHSTLAQLRVVCPESRVVNIASLEQVVPRLRESGELFLFAGDHPEVSLFRMAAEVARSHHENFDGSGYPDRLRGDAIPLAARMLRVLDALEAAVEAPPMLDQMRDEVAQGGGVHFDPEVAQAFAETFDELADVVENHFVAQLPQLTAIRARAPASWVRDGCWLRRRR